MYDVKYVKLNYQEKPMPSVLNEECNASHFVVGLFWGGSLKDYDQADGTKKPYLHALLQPFLWRTSPTGQYHDFQEAEDTFTIIYEHYPSGGGAVNVITLPYNYIIKVLL